MSCSLGIPHCTRYSAGYEGLLYLLEEGKSYNVFVQAQLAMQQACMTYTDVMHIGACINNELS